MEACSWFSYWANTYGEFPDDYLVIDIETSGPDIDKDLIVQIGWCHVIDRKPISNNGLLLNWDKSPLIDTNWLRHRLNETLDYMLTVRQVDSYPWTYDAILSGDSPLSVLTRFLNILREARTNNTLLVAHNGVRFDCPVLSNHFRRFLKIHHDFDDDEIWDTGALEKASQLNELLCEGESTNDFAYRVTLRSNDYGVKWNLHDFCIPKYDLDLFDLELNKAHTAPFDAYVTHLLFEQYRQLSNKGVYCG
jgi:DNA polymerase III epsilon subunit-like protein